MWRVTFAALLLLALVFGIALHINMDRDCLRLGAVVKLAGRC